MGAVEEMVRCLKLSPKPDSMFVGFVPRISSYTCVSFLQQTDAVNVGSKVIEKDGDSK